MENNRRGGNGRRTEGRREYGNEGKRPRISRAGSRGAERNFSDDRSFSSERPRRSFGEGSERRSFGSDRPRRSFGEGNDRPRRSFGDRKSVV